MKTLRGFVCQVLFLSLLAIVCVAQKSDASEIYAESWSTDPLREQKFNVELDSIQNEYTEPVRRWGGVGYKLIFLKIAAGEKDYQLEHWVVQLREVLSKENAKKEKLGCNLLTVRGCSPGGDYFPREDLVGYLFPRENPTKIDILLRGNYYPLKAKRVIKVKSFYVVIKVNSYQMNETNPKKLDAMNVTVEFKNNYGFNKNN